jgi:hypothetical protein
LLSDPIPQRVVFLIDPPSRTTLSQHSMPTTDMANDRQPHPGLSTQPKHQHWSTPQPNVDPRRRKTIYEDLFSELNSIRPLAVGVQDLRRFAVGLQPILDPRASPAFTLTTPEKTRKRQPTTTSAIDRPRAFRNDTKGCHERTCDLQLTLNAP